MASLTMVMLQSSGSDTHILTACFVLITVVLVVQAVVLIGAGVAAKKSQQRLLEIAEDIKKTATPFLLEARTVVLKTGDLIDDVGPALRSISRNVDAASANVVIASETLKNKAQEMDELTSEIKQRTQLQVRRVDNLVTNGLEAIADIGSSLHRAVLVPVREIGAIMNGVKAGLDTLLGKARKFGVYPGGRDTRSDEEIGL